MMRDWNAHEPAHAVRLRSPLETLVRKLLTQTRGRVWKMSVMLRRHGLYDTDDLVQEYYEYHARHPNANEDNPQYIAQELGNVLVDVMRKELGRPERSGTIPKRTLQFYAAQATGQEFFEVPDPKIEQAPDLHRVLLTAVRKLVPRLQIVLILYYWHDVDMKDIGPFLHRYGVCNRSVSESRVCQLHAEALLKLRRYLPPEHDLW